MSEEENSLTANKTADELEGRGERRRKVEKIGSWMRKSYQDAKKKQPQPGQHPAGPARADDLPVQLDFSNTALCRVTFPSMLMIPSAEVVLLRSLHNCSQTL